MPSESPLDAVELTRDLIRRPSVTPADAGAMAVVEETLRRLGFACRRMKFGEIAISLGLCHREQIFEAWCTQLADEIRSAGHDKVGVDLTAAACFPHDVARRWGVLPIRNFAGMVVTSTMKVMPPPGHT